MSQEEIAEKVDVEKVLVRFRQAFGLDSDKEVAEIFDISQQNFHHRKKRGTILPLMIGYSIDKNVNLHWLLTGEGSSGPKCVADEDEIANPDVADLVKRAKLVLTSGNQMAFDALARNIRYFSHAVESERRLIGMEGRVSALEEMVRNIKESEAKKNDKDHCKER
ncbi:MAG: helix-turn-helix domain-containing protein [Syntrophobacter sp.]